MFMETRNLFLDMIYKEYLFKSRFYIYVKRINLLLILYQHYGTNKLLFLS